MLDSDPANHLADEATDEPTPANAMQQPVADDLPRPPSGRRSAIRPAGPPQPVSLLIPEPVPAELPTEPAEESAAPEEQGVADVAPQAEGPIDVTPGPVSDESTATSDAESVEAPEGVGAQQTPVQEVSTENTQPQQEPSDQPAAMPTDKPAQKRSPRTSRPQTSTEGLAGTSSSSNRRRRSGRGKAATESMAQAETEHGASSEIEAALSAVEASPQSRTRRATRTSAAGLIGVEVPTDAAGEVHTCRCWRPWQPPLRAARMGRQPPSLSPVTQPAQLEGAAPQRRRLSAARPWTRPQTTRPKRRCLKARRLRPARTNPTKSRASRQAGPRPAAGVVAVDDVAVVVPVGRVMTRASRTAISPMNRTKPTTAALQTTSRMRRITQAPAPSPSAARTVGVAGAGDGG